MKINDELIENLLKDKSGLRQENTKNLTKTLVEKYKDPKNPKKKKKKKKSFFDHYIKNGEKKKKKKKKFDSLINQHHVKNELL
ncbi:hypothetical protein [Staphylococcus capitis]|uniref:hypothetical protein n=1 Tax=Staphylococcus capitis TaxID=29388 RepID=UPI002F26AE76